MLCQGNQRLPATWCSNCVGRNEYSHLKGKSHCNETS